MAQVLINLPSASARATSPLADERRRTRTASSADEATCDWTPPSRRTTSATERLPTGSTSWRLMRHASACGHPIFRSGGAIGSLRLGTA